MPLDGMGDVLDSMEPGSSQGLSFLIGPLTAFSTPSPAVIRLGDTTPILVALASAIGPVDVSSSTLTLYLRSAWDDANIPGGVVTSTSTTGQVAVALPALTYPGYYYAYITDGLGNSYPDTGVGFLIVVAPAAV